MALPRPPVQMEPLRDLRDSQKLDADVWMSLKETYLSISPERAS